MREPELRRCTCRQNNKSRTHQPVMMELRPLRSKDRDRALVEAYCVYCRDCGKTSSVEASWQDAETDWNHLVQA